MNANVAKCLLISKVLVADGMMTDDEHTFLGNLMEKLGLSDDERRRVINLEDWDKAEPIINDLSMDERQDIIEMLIDAAGADGKLSALELATVKQVTTALGLKA